MVNKAGQKRKIEIISAQYGTVTLAPEQVITFEQGLIGLEAYKHYGLFQPEDIPFYILLSMDGEIGFILALAHDIVQDYQFKLAEETVNLLEVKDASEVLTYVILNFADDQVYVNLKAPILIAPLQGKGCQYVITDRDYPIRQVLFPKEQS